MDNEASDETLLKTFLKDHDEQSFRSLFGRHTPYLYLLTLRLVGGNHPDAEDLIQETWLRAARKLADFRGESALRTWLTSIALNCYREFASKQRQRTNSQDSLRIVGGNARESLDLEQLIYRLSEPHREVLILHDVEGYTHEEIGNHLGIQPGTSKSRLFEARKTLRSWLEPGRDMKAGGKK